MKDDIKSKSIIEETVNSKSIFNGRVISVKSDSVRLVNGDISSREVVDHPGGVCVIAVTEKEEIFLVRQYRYPYKDEVLEIPAGKLELGELPIECAKRELAEEVGVIGKNYASLGIMYPTPGYCSEKIYIYSCEVESFCEQHLDEDEFLYVEKILLGDALKMVMSNEIKDAKTQIAVLKMCSRSDLL